MSRTALQLRYKANLPRYTSYPPAPHFQPIAPEVAEQALARAAEALSLYAHVPFCTKMCWYCGCNKEIRRRPPAVAYVDDLRTELELVARALQGTHRVHQLHLGGGTPTSLPVSQLARLLEAIDARIPLAEGAEVALEIDPRSVDGRAAHALVDAGFNRFSIGVQDFDPQVMRAINREQPRALTDAIVSALRERGDYSISFDLLYGLPHQSPGSLRRTLDAVVELAPGRIALFPYAHVPHLRPSQKLLEREGLPGPALRSAMLKLAVAHLIDAGYVRIGMDHFARPGDSLHTAWSEGRLHRNFQGYTTHPELELIGLGPSALGCYGGLHTQSEHDRERWQQRVRAGELPVVRGWQLSEDDQRRARIIADLLCHGQARLGRNPHERFRPELRRLEAMGRDGLVQLEPESVRLTALGQDFSRHVAAVFDAYLARDVARYSSTL